MDPRSQSLKEEFKGITAKIYDKWYNKEVQGEMWADSRSN